MMKLKLKLKQWYVLVIVLIVSVSVIGCSTNDLSNGNNQERTGQEQQTDAEEQGNGEQQGDHEQDGELNTVYPLTLTDASGLEITFKQAPQRIVSLSPSETEVLFALGLDDRIVGVTEWCDYPVQATEKPKVGSFDGNAETIIAAEPDLVVGILSLNNPQYIENYRQYGLTVFTFEPQTLEEAMERILLLGVITDTQAQAEKVVAEMREDVAKVTAAVEQLGESASKKVYIEYSEGWTVGRDVFMDEMVTLAGGTNVVSDVSGWVEVNEESIIQANPDVILYPTYFSNLEEIVKQRSGWSEVNAVKNNRFVAINDDLISRPGPRLSKGLIEVANALHPGLIP